MKQYMTNNWMSRAWVLVLAVVFLAIILASPAWANSGVPDGDRPAFDVTVVSSAADMVTGGDARLHIDVPRTVPLHQVMVLVNGADLSDRFSAMPGTRILTGVVDGLDLGENTVMVKANGRGRGRPQTVASRCQHRHPGPQRTHSRPG